MGAKAVFYFDTSALVKRYIPEKGMEWVRTCTGTEKVIFAEIGIVEVAAALSKRTRMGDLDKAIYEDLLETFLQDVDEKYQLLTAARDTFNLAIDLTKRHPLRAYDAVQLATALQMAQALEVEELSLTFVSADDQLCTAAEQEDLAIVNPNQLP